MFIIVALLLLPILCVAAILIFFVFTKKKATNMAAGAKKIILEGTAHDVATDPQEDPLARNDLNSYDLKVLTLRKTMTEYLHSLYQDNFVSWEALDPKGLLRDNPIRIKAFLRNEVKPLCIIKLPTTDGFSFDLYSSTVTASDKREADSATEATKKECSSIEELDSDEEPAPVLSKEDGNDSSKETIQTAKQWIDENIHQLEGLQEKAVKEEADFFCLPKDFFPQTLLEEIRDLLELDLFRLEIRNNEVRIYF